ncbi:MAG: biotin/lipoyl-containing protein, partial [Flavitalea sp.]
MIDIKVPTVGESISEVTLLKWVKKEGDYVQRDEVIAELESEKATFEVNAEKAGTLKLSAKEGDTLKIGDVIASIDETAVQPAGAAPEAPATAAAKPAAQPEVKAAVATETKAPADIKATPVASAI